jgi:hypothetical protein
MKTKISLMDDNGNEVDFITQDLKNIRYNNLSEEVKNSLYLLVKRNIFKIHYNNNFTLVNSFYNFCLDHLITL